jgi:hypothetical protein
MAKLTKSMLKGMVKECLVEILSEGLAGSEQISESKSRQSKKTRRAQKKNQSIFDQMDEAFERKPRAADSITFDQKVNNIAKAATSDSVLQDILADTARTTLQEQLQHESLTPDARGGSHPATPNDLMNSDVGLDIGSLFGEAAKNWGEVLERTARKPL